MEIVAFLFLIIAKGLTSQTSASLDLQIGSRVLGLWFPGQVALSVPRSRYRGRHRDTETQSRGIHNSSCRLELGREAPPLTAPHETLMPVRCAAISQHPTADQSPWI